MAAHYLGKFEPFLTVQRLLQNGVCDSVDRQFKGLEQQWNKI